jgi:hypothetical protein
MKMGWVKHSVSKSIEWYHLNCRIKEDGSHEFDVSVIVRGNGTFSVYMPEKAAGAPLLREFNSLEKVNRFLKELEYPKLELYV